MKAKLKATILICLIMLSLCACESESKTPELTQFPKLITPSPTDAKITVAATNASSKDPLEDEDSLTILLYGNSAKPETHPLYLLAQEFMRVNPGKVINCEFLSALRNYSSNETITKISNAKDGRSADIIEIRNLSDMSWLKFRMAFVDINKMMDSDPDFRREEYFEGIFDGVTVDGKLELLPLEASFTYFTMNRTYESYSNSSAADTVTIDFKQMIDIYERSAAVAANDLYLLDYPVDTWAVFWSFDIDSINDGAEVNLYDDLRGVSLLRHWLGIREINPVFFNANASAGNGYWTSPGDVESVYRKYPDNINLKSLFLDYPGVEYTQPVALIGLNGKISYTPGTTVAINEKCPDKDLAWEFVKFCAENRPIVPSGETEPLYAFTNSVNKQSFREANELDFSKLYRKNADQGFISSQSESSSIVEAVNRLTEMMEQCGQLERLNSDLKSIFDVWSETYTGDLVNNQLSGYYYSSAVGQLRASYIYHTSQHYDFTEDRMIKRYNRIINELKRFTPLLDTGEDGA